MKIYLAGKIQPGDWREAFIDKNFLVLGEEALKSFRSNEQGNPYWPIIRKGFHGLLDYVGPFLYAEEYKERWLEHLGSGTSIASMREADIVYGFFNEGPPDPDLCAALGLAIGLGKIVLVGVHENSLLTDDLIELFVNEATEINHGFTEPGIALFELLHRQEWLCQSPIEVSFFKAARNEHIPLFCQFPVGPYRLDFAEPFKKVAIELDGHDFHKTKEQRTHDAKRDRFLTENGWRVLRFTGTEIHKDVRRCVKQIKAIIETLTKSEDD